MNSLIFFYAQKKERWQYLINFNFITGFKNNSMSEEILLESK